MLELARDTHFNSPCPPRRNDADAAEVKGAALYPSMRSGWAGAGHIPGGDTRPTACAVSAVIAP